MADQQIRIKIGQNEFEASGDEETIKRELDRFYQVIESLGRQQSPRAKIPRQPPKSDKGEPEPSRIPENYSAVFAYEDKTLTLVAKLPGQSREGDAALLLLYGYREIQGLATVPASSLLMSMKRTGYTIARVDRLLSFPLIGEGLILKSGARRGSAYQLTRPGYQMAAGLSEELRSLIQ